MGECRVEGSIRRGRIFDLCQFTFKKPENVTKVFMMDSAADNDGPES